MFGFEFAPQARKDLDWFRKNDQKRICDGVEKQLCHQPLVQTRNRKRLRPGHVSQWELRIGDLRVFYDVDADAETPLVTIVAIGYKEGNKLFFRGKEFET
jgi:mRNA-degrading endonuclease RelE of RelBE toxin-antitoxin system